MAPVREIAWNVISVPVMVATTKTRSSAKLAAVIADGVTPPFLSWPLSRQ